MHAAVSIIGAGPAGLFAALQCAERGLSVQILESQKSAGRKLLLAGSGRCNLANAAPLDEQLKRYGDAGVFVKPPLYHFSPSNLISYLATKGLSCIERNDGKLFPESERSADVLNLLLGECERLNVSIRYSSAVQSIDHNDSGFHLTADTGLYSSAHIIIATGGKSYPATGSNGSGHALAASLGHTIQPCKPSLTPVIVKDYGFAGCSGIALENCRVNLHRGGKKIREAEGDLLFTHRGLSGPVILDMSRYINPGDIITAAIAGETGAERIETLFTDQARISGSKTAKGILLSLKIPERVAVNILTSLGIDGGTVIARLSRDSRKKIAQALTALPFTVQKTGDFSEAMATSGGVTRAEINPKTMESRIVTDLYFAGEVIDVDGDTGGFNIQFAFSSASLAAHSIGKKYNALTTGREA